jgi:hypothetical protein
VLHTHRSFGIIVLSSYLALGLLGSRFIPRSSYRRTCIRFTKDLWYPLIIIWIPCFGFGAFHVTGLFGIWVSDAFGLTGRVQPVAPAWGPDGTHLIQVELPHHIAAGTLELLLGFSI